MQFKTISCVLLAAAALLVSCKGPVEPKVMARAVPERADDFVWENDLVAYRAYGKALERETLSPGLDVWVKQPGALVADEWYSHIGEDPAYYHKNHGGKDCYKVGMTLGGGASAPYYDGRLHFPATNWRSSEILESGPEKVVFVLHYPEWEENGVRISLDKKITVRAGTRFCLAEDCYKGNFDTLTVAAGLVLHDVMEGFDATDRFAIWETASDQSVEKEDGMIGLAVVMPGASQHFVISGRGEHSVLTKTVRSGETLSYYFGSCWSAGGVADGDEWFSMVKSFDPESFNLASEK